MRFVSYTDRKKIAAGLRPIYTAPTADAAETALLEFADSDLGRRNPAVVATWQNAWERFIPFLAFPPAVRKIIYTTNAIESLNYQLRKVIKNRGHFPNDDAVIKLLWLAIRDIEDKRARARAKEKSLPRGDRKASGRLVEGAVTQGWRPAFAGLLIAFPDRLEQPDEPPPSHGQPRHRLPMPRLRRADHPAALPGLHPVHPPARPPRPLPAL